MAIKNYLIEGVSGSGKSSVCDELQRRGHAAINGDKELGYNGNPETGEPLDSHGHKTWIWDVNKVKALVNSKDRDVLFFCGGSRNFNKFIDLFDNVFVLDVDDTTIKTRLMSRTDNAWGKKQEELELILKLNKTKEDIPKKGVIIDATQPLNSVVDEILNYVHRNSC